MPTKAVTDFKVEILNTLKEIVTRYEERLGATRTVPQDRINGIDSVTSMVQLLKESHMAMPLIHSLLARTIGQVMEGYTELKSGYSFFEKPTKHHDLAVRITHFLNEIHERILEDWVRFIVSEDPEINQLKTLQVNGEKIKRMTEKKLTDRKSLLTARGKNPDADELVEDLNSELKACDRGLAKFKRELEMHDLEKSRRFFHEHLHPAIEMIESEITKDSGNYAHLCKALIETIGQVEGWNFSEKSSAVLKVSEPSTFEPRMGEGGGGGGGGSAI